MSDEVAAHSAGGIAPSHSGDRVAYANKPGLTGLLIKNFFLTVVTIGFYRFWARARLRRYFWSNIVIAGEPLEYTGTGLELFLGFLIALAVLAPCGIAYVTLQRVMLGNPTAEAVLSLCYFLGLIIFVQVVIFRARRYRLSRTTWRGIYAAQTGSAWRYLVLSLLWGVIVVATLGLATPWRNVDLERYKIDHSWFGESRFALDARGRDLLPYWLIVMALLILPLVALIASNLGFIPQFLAAALQAQAAHKPFIPPRPHAVWLLAMVLLGGGPALVWYWVTTFRYFTSRTRLGETLLHSHARGTSVLTTVLLFMLGMAGVSIAFTVFIVLVFIIVMGVSVAVVGTGATTNPAAIGAKAALGFAIL